MMEHWTEKIKNLVEGISLQALTKERERLTDFYRHRKGKELPALQSYQQRLIYLLSRMPSTYAAVHRVGMELYKRVSSLHIHSVLDVGSGPGTVLFALHDQGIDFKEITMLERDVEFIAIAQKLSSNLLEFRKTWICKDVLHVDMLPIHDLVIASYCLNELEEKERIQIVEKLWAVTGQFLILIEPGTSEDFRISKRIREKLISWGGYLVAPCPHQNSCPLPLEDWCHFSARVERSSLQRKVKEAFLNYEDEKFFYLIFSKKPQNPCLSRLIKRPLRGKGFVKIQLCSNQGIEEITCTKKQSSVYSKLKKLGWGDELDLKL